MKAGLWSAMDMEEARPGRYAASPRFWSLGNAGAEGCIGQLASPLVGSVNRHSPPEPGLHTEAR
jgi:hypothetical protein